MNEKFMTTFKKKIKQGTLYACCAKKKNES